MYLSLSDNPLWGCELVFELSEKSLVSLNCIKKGAKDILDALTQTVPGVDHLTRRKTANVSRPVDTKAVTTL